MNGLEVARIIRSLLDVEEEWDKYAGRIAFDYQDKLERAADTLLEDLVRELRA